MRKKKLLIKQTCPFCGRVVLADKDADYLIRENKYLQKARQYFHKSCYQKFYSGEKIIYDRTASFTESNEATYK